jgi:hypothetical protein
MEPGHRSNWSERLNSENRKRKKGSNNLQHKGKGDKSSKSPSSRTNDFSKEEGHEKGAARDEREGGVGRGPQRD